MRFLTLHGQILEAPPTGLPEVGTELTMTMHQEGHAWPHKGRRRVPPAGHARFWVSHHRHVNLGGDWGAGLVNVAITASHRTPGVPRAEWWPAHEPPFESSAHLCPVPTCDRVLVFTPVTVDEYLNAGGGQLVPARLGSVESHLEQGMHPDDQAALRRALLQRLVDRAAIVEAVWAGRARLPDDCCTVEYTDRDGVEAAMFLCDATCDHWHHDQDVWIA